MSQSLSEQVNVFQASITKNYSIYTIKLSQLDPLFLIMKHVQLYFFFPFWLHWVFVALHRLSLVAVSGSYSSLMGASHCSGFSCCRALPLEPTGFSSCGIGAQLLCRMWALPGPRMGLLFRVLAGGILTTEPPDKSLKPLKYVGLRDQTIPCTVPQNFMIVWIGIEFY